MFKYFKADKVLKEKLNSYTNKGEYLLVSDGIKYKEMEYREVLFNKKNLLIQEVKGIVYIDENNNIVQDKNIQKSLARLYYYYEIFFCLDKKNNIFKALRNEEDLHKENKDIELSIKALEFLQKEKIKDNLNGKLKIDDVIFNMILVKLYSEIQSIELEFKELEANKTA